MFFVVDILPPEQIDHFARISTIHGLDFTDENVGAIVNVKEYATTANGGTLWTAVNPNQPLQGWEFYGVEMLDSNSIYIAGGLTNGAIFHSNDGGASWGIQVDNQYGVFNDIKFANPTSGWAVGELGTILHTSDGSTWGPQSSGASELLWGIKPS